ncbi:MAG TPA: DUF2231 domain-containing protein [Symbiobacteriaceae bacterium]|nr:DUF2231 domain-containing protein [Symbiobacteriaceae bacterium]
MFGHPLHPIAVHLPVMLLIGGVLVDLASTRPAWFAWRRAGFIHLLAGTVGALLAAVTGAIDAIKATTPDGGAMLMNHALFSGLATVVFGIMLALRIAFRSRQTRAGVSRDELEVEVPRRSAAVYFALAVLGVGLLIATGFTGGELVYVQGVGTALQ